MEEYSAIDSHKSVLHGAITEDTLAREERIKSLISGYFDRINTLENETIREKIDALETMLSTPEVTGRRTVTDNRIQPGLFILGLSNFKIRPLLIIADNKERMEVKAFRLVSFSCGAGLPDDKRDDAIYKKLLSEEYYVYKREKSDTNYLKGTKHFYYGSDFHFRNMRDDFNGFIDTKLSQIETIPYENIIKILDPNNADIAKLLYENAVKSVILQQKERKSETKKLREELEEKEKLIKELRAGKAKAERRARIAAEKLSNQGLE